MSVIERVKDGIRESGRLYGYVNNIWGTTEHVDFQVKRGLEKNLFPFPVFYAIKTQSGEGFKILRVFLEKDLTQGTLSEYVKSVADPNHWRSTKHANAMGDLMRDL